MFPPEQQITIGIRTGAQDFLNFWNQLSDLDLPGLFEQGTSVWRGQFTLYALIYAGQHLQFLQSQALVRQILVEDGLEFFARLQQDCHGEQIFAGQAVALAQACFKGKRLETRSLTQVSLKRARPVDFALNRRDLVPARRTGAQAELAADARHDIIQELIALRQEFEIAIILLEDRMYGQLASGVKFAEIPPKRTLIMLEQETHDTPLHIL